MTFTDPQVLTTGAEKIDRETVLRSSSPMRFFDAVLCPADERNYHLTNGCSQVGYQQLEAYSKVTCFRGLLPLHAATERFH